MGDDKYRSMCWQIVPTMLMLAIIGSASDGALCPVVCHCEDEALITSCASASLEFVPIQLNPEIRDIDLSNNKISNLHFTLSFYDKLVNLDLSNNKIRTLGSSNFESQRDLKHLNLSKNEIEKLSRDSLKGLRALTVLDMSYNRLEELTSIAFRELHSLTVVRLCGNRLVHLEEGLFKSTKHLQELFLDDNQFLEVPTSALTDAISLHRLSLSRNLIESVGEGEMPVLPELHTLLLDSNIISDIHSEAMSGLLALDHLDLSDNNFTVTPTNSLAKLFNLTILRLSGNFITNIPPVAFRGLFHLKILKLDRLEDLEQIDSRAFVDNINLEKVWMDFNIKIDRLPTRLFHGNPRVKYVSARYNKLETLEATHFPLDQLRELKLGGNPLQCNCSLAWLWHLVNQYKTKISKKDNQTYDDYNKQDNLNSVSNDLILDVDDIRCIGPEELQNKLLADVTKTQIDCSVGWMAAVSVTITIVFILAVVGGVVYWSPTRRQRTTKKDLSSVENRCRNRTPTLNNGIGIGIGIGEPYDVSRVEKCMMPPPLIHNDYRSLPSWDPYGAHCTSTMNIYEQLDDNTKTRPHIVYV